MTKQFCRRSGNGSVTSKLVLYRQHPTPIDGLLDVELSLERVCRQVRNEFMHLLWTKNTFQIHADNLTELARKSGTRARLIRKVLIYSVGKVRKDGVTGDLYLHPLLDHALRELQKFPHLEQICVHFRKSALKSTTEDAILHELKQAWKPAGDGQVIDLKLKIWLAMLGVQEIMWSFSSHGHVLRCLSYESYTSKWPLLSSHSPLGPQSEGRYYIRLLLPSSRGRHHYDILVLHSVRTPRRLSAHNEHRHDVTSLRHMS